MNSAWKELHPQDSFTVKLSNILTSHDEQLISMLYQPIIGVEAFGLYHGLLTHIDDNDFDSHELLHSELFNHLNLDLPKIYNARIKLEGIGLLKVFKKTNENYRHFIYELQPPMSAQDVFTDDVLSVLLLSAVGQTHFNKLVKRFSIPHETPMGYEEVTQKFVDVYQFNGEQVAANEQHLKQVKNQFVTSEPTKISAVRDSFDWEYFMSLLNDFFLDKNSITQEVKETIYTLHNLYGIDELAMRDLVEPSVDYVANEIKINQLRQQVIKKYHGEKPQNQVALSADETDLSASDQSIRRKNTLLQKGYSQADIDFIATTENYSPMLFLESIKDQKRGFITDNERYTVEGLMKRSSLPDSVINLLIHYILVIQDNASLNKTYAESIANDWAQSQVKTPEDALEKVKQLSTPTVSAPKRQYSKKTYSKTNNRKETTPEWVGQQNQETRVSKEAEERLKDRIKKLRENSKEGDS